MNKPIQVHIPGVDEHRTITIYTTEVFCVVCGALARYCTCGKWGLCQAEVRVRARRVIS